MYVELREEGDLLEVVIDRPERRNALDGAGWTVLRDVFRAHPSRESVRALLIRSTGSVFCGGADLNWLRDAGDAEIRMVYDAIAALRAYPRPVVCRVQGPTFGGGIGLVAASDVVVADPGATFTMTEVRLGIAPALIASFVAERVGSARFRSWSILGMTVDAERAFNAGLVDLLSPAGGVDVATAEVIEAIRRGEPRAITAVKSLPREGLDGDEATTLLSSLRDRPEFTEGVAALRSGRLPNWVGPGTSSR